MVRKTVVHCARNSNSIPLAGDIWAKWKVGLHTYARKVRAVRVWSTNHLKWSFVGLRSDPNYGDFLSIVTS